MNNIIQYLWQAVSEPQVSIRIVDTIAKQKQIIHYYFYSEKQSKILRKKKQNSYPSNIIEQYERKCGQRFNILYIGFLCTFSPFNRRMISGAELIDELYDNSSSFIFVNLSSLSNPRLFVLYVNGQQKSIKPLQKKFQLEQFQSNKIFQFFNILVTMISSATLRKSDKILKAQIIVAISQDNVYLVFADVLKVNEDYYHISYQYHNQQTKTNKKKVSSQLLYCETCDQVMEKDDRKEINYEGALIIKTVKKKSKYGLNPTRIYNVCFKCYNLLFSAQH